jgi:hypothetical protein
MRHTGGVPRRWWTSTPNPAPEPQLGRDWAPRPIGNSALPDRAPRLPTRRAQQAGWAAHVASRVHHGRAGPGVPSRDVQEAASHPDPRTAMRYDRGRQSLDHHATYILSTFLAGAFPVTPLLAGRSVRPEAPTAAGTPGASPSICRAEGCGRRAHLVECSRPRAGGTALGGRAPPGSGGDYWRALSDRAGVHFAGYERVTTTHPVVIIGWVPSAVDDPASKGYADGEVGAPGGHGESSRSGESRPINSSTRSRASSFSRLRWRATYFSPSPPFDKRELAVVHGE